MCPVKSWCVSILQITDQWGRRYHEWIAKAEKKMAELQEVNTYLYVFLRA